MLGAPNQKPWKDMSRGERIAAGIIYAVAAAILGYVILCALSEKFASV